METLPWLEGGKLPPKIANKIARLGPGGCWEWGAAKTNGYGVVQWNGKIRRAHRVVYEVLRGPIPTGLEMDHLCRNRGCVNPDHVEPVPQSVNNARSDSASAKNARKTHCLNGHPFSADNTYYARTSRGRRTRVCRECCRAGRRSVTGTANYQRGEAHHNTKLTEALVLEIRSAHDERGESMGSLSRRLGVAIGHIHRIVHRKAWAHLGKEVSEP